MIDPRKYSELFDERVEVACTDGTIIVGEWSGWTSAEDNEPDGESITIDREHEGPVEIPVEEIKTIQKAHN